jgi:hypothetical protein
MGRSRTGSTTRVLETNDVVRQAVNDAVARHPDVDMDIRLHGHILDPRIERIAIGRPMHPDEMGRPCYDMVAPVTDTPWREELDRLVASHARKVARLHERRADIGADGHLRRRAWDVHPVVSSLLSHYPRMPRFDGSHRLDGQWGRVVQLGSAPGIVEATIAYGDGVIRLVSATLEDGSTLTQEHDELAIVVRQRYPETMIQALARTHVANVCDLLSADPRAARHRTRSAEHARDGLRIVFRDVLVPWDRRAPGREPWRLSRLGEPRVRRRAAA